MKSSVWCIALAILAGCREPPHDADDSIPLRFELEGRVELRTALPDSARAPRAVDDRGLDPAAAPGADSSAATIVTPDGRMFVERSAFTRARRPTSVPAQPLLTAGDAHAPPEQAARAEEPAGPAGAAEGAPNELTPSGTWLEGVSLPDGRVPITSTSSWPARTIVAFTGTGLCSGAFIGPRHVLTAAHCLYARGYGFYVPGYVIPGQKGAGAEPPYGKIAVHHVVVPNEYRYAITAEDDLKYDYALIVTADSSFSVGWLGFGFGYSDLLIDGVGYPSPIYPCYHSPSPGKAPWDAPWGPCDGHQYWQASNISEYASFWAFSWLDGQSGQSGMPWSRSNNVYMIHHGAQPTTNRSVAKRLASGSFSSICDWIADSPSAYWNHDCY